MVPHWICNCCASSRSDCDHSRLLPVVCTHVDVMLVELTPFDQSPYIVSLIGRRWGCMARLHVKIQRRPTYHSGRPTGHHRYCTTITSDFDTRSISHQRRADVGATSNHRIPEQRSIRMSRLLTLERIYPLAQKLVSGSGCPSSASL